MKEIIRHIEASDFEAIASLFDSGNTVEELKWLFSDVYNKNNFNGFVATDENNEVIGVIGYILSTYTIGDKKFTGMVPMSWKLKENYKGMAGVSLFKKVSEIGTINMAIGGSDVARKLYPMFKYQLKNYAENYYKVIRPIDYFRVLKRRSLIKKIAMYLYLLPSYFKKQAQKELIKDIDFIPYNGENFVKKKKYDNIPLKEIDKNHIDWFLNCPTIMSYAFVVKHRNESLGICVLYKFKIENSYLGRIVYLPYLDGQEDIWASIIYKCTEFLKKEKCCSVSCISINSHHQNALIKAGFTKINIHKEPIYIKDTKNVLGDFNLDDWYFQFSEGDIALRKFQ